MESTGTTDPADALELVAGTRADLADRLVTPWWYHPAFALLAGALVASFAADSLVVSVVALVAYAAGVLGLSAAYRRLTGVWVSGRGGGRARRWAARGGLAIGVAIALSAPLAAAEGTITFTPAPIVAAVVLVPVLVLCGRRFDEELRAELRAGR